MYETGQPCKRNESVNATLWYAEKSNINFDEREDCQHRLGLFFSFILPLYLFSHSLWFSIALPFLHATTVPEQHMKSLGNHWLQQLQLLDFVTLSEITEIFKLTSEQGPVIEDVRF